MNYGVLVTAALEDLNSAAEKMVAQTTPATPMPRPRIFIICETVSWPFLRSDSSPYEEATHFRDRIASKIVVGCKKQPRLILRAIRRIQAATAWCKARTEGRRRQAEEILRQQSAAVEALEAEAAMLALK